MPKIPFLHFCRLLFGITVQLFVIQPSPALPGQKEYFLKLVLNCAISIKQMPRFQLLSEFAAIRVSFSLVSHLS